MNSSKVNHLSLKKKKKNFFIRHADTTRDNSINKTSRRLFSSQRTPSDRLVKYRRLHARRTFTRRTTQIRSMYLFFLLRSPSLSWIMREQQFLFGARGRNSIDEGSLVPAISQLRFFSVRQPIVTIQTRFTCWHFLL